ncbi:MAG: bifunctional riboflavin kinase/FAD synthetase [Campylobacteraceae bacterium]|nr:bifunctional riboflavin kinase/FAD synthetase [Campylobacteraceae bacterium]
MVTMKNSSILKNKSIITSISIGGFDGMHKAHQELFKNLDATGGILVIDGGYSTLTPKSIRQEYTQFPVFYYPLQEIKHLNAEEFIAYLMKDFPKLNKIVVGYDFCFGTNRKYSTKDLKKLFKHEVKVVDEVSINKISVHSRIIRDYLKQGDIKTSNLLLGNTYKIRGTHIKGQGLGSKSFVPTINLKVDEYILPNEGVYITKTTINLKEYQSVSFLGHRVSTDNSYAVETHILESYTPENIDKVDISFVEKIRNNEKFDSFEDLKTQILLDIDQSKLFFKTHKNP